MTNAPKNRAFRSGQAFHGMMEERGATLVQTILILPVFLMIAIGGYQVWRAQSVRESLRSGTYQATRYLSINPNTSGWSDVARGSFILPELLNNPLLEPELAHLVSVSAPEVPLECGASFTVLAELPWRAVIPFVAQEDWVIRVQYEGEVTCG